MTAAIPIAAPTLAQGIEHPDVNDLFTMLIGHWFIAHPEQTAQSLGGCLIEKSTITAASPDIMVYVGAGGPKWRVPDLGKTSGVLAGLPIGLLEETLEQLSQGTNISAANWFMGAIGKL